jgi:hypothetical protein
VRRQVAAGLQPFADDGEGVARLGHDTPEQRVEHVEADNLDATLLEQFDRPVEPYVV